MMLPMIMIVHSHALDFFSSLPQNAFSSALITFLDERREEQRGDFLRLDDFDGDNPPQKLENEEEEDKNHRRRSQT